VVALDRKSGATVWRSKDWTDRAAYSSVIVAVIDGVRQYIQISDANVAGIAAKDGTVLWKAKRKGSTAVIPTPIYKNNHVLVSSGYGVGCNLFKITKGSAGFEAAEVYANKDLVNHHGGMVLVGDHVYAHSDSKGWVCMEFLTGKLAWSNPGVGKGAVVCADGRLYTRKEDKQGTVALVEVSPDGYKEHGRFAQAERGTKNSWAHPVIANGRLYLRDQDVLLCYNVTAK
jgi:outer membrane protein assembly factor BamB